MIMGNELGYPEGRPTPPPHHTSNKQECGVISKEEFMQQFLLRNYDMERAPCVNVARASAVYDGIKKRLK